MNTFHVDWSPTINLGHNKIGEDKLKNAQERAERAISRKRKREDDEFEAQMMEEELLEQESLIEDTRNDKVCHNKETETEHKGDLPVDFLMRGISLMMIIKFVTTLGYQIERYY